MSHETVARIIEALLEVLGDVGVPGASAARLAIRGVESLRKSQAARRRLEELLQQAEEDFLQEARREGLEPVAQWVTSLPLQNLPTFRQALKDLRTHWDEESLTDRLAGEFARIPAIREAQKARALALYMTCLRRQLLADDDFRQVVVSLSILRTEGGVERLLEEVDALYQALNRLIGLPEDLVAWPVETLDAQAVRELRADLLLPPLPPGPLHRQGLPANPGGPPGLGPGAGSGPAAGGIARLHRPRRRRQNPPAHRGRRGPPPGRLVDGLPAGWTPEPRQRQPPDRRRPPPPCSSPTTSPTVPMRREPCCARPPAPAGSEPPPWPSSSWSAPSPNGCKRTFRTTPTPNTWAGRPSSASPRWRRRPGRCPPWTRRTVGRSFGRPRARFAALLPADGRSPPRLRRAAGVPPSTSSCWPC